MVAIWGLRENDCYESVGLGIFDGMHLGHQQILKNCSHLLTFWPHPDFFLNKSSDLAMLTTLRELRYYVKSLLAIRFNQQIASLPPLKFLDDIILGQLNPKKLVVGYDFKFGYKHQGNIHLLRQWSEKNNIILKVISPIKVQQVPLKSSLIRTYMQQGKFDLALQCLGHSYLIMGRVIAGDQVGRKLGFPTANLKIPAHKMVPPKGVYSGEVAWNGQVYKCLIYRGTRPTLNQGEPRVEVHILNFSKNLYGQQICVFLQKKIRDELFFEHTDALIAQIQRDIQSV